MNIDQAMRRAAKIAAEKGAPPARLFVKYVERTNTYKYELKWVTRQGKTVKVEAETLEEVQKQVSTEEFEALL